MRIKSISLKSKKVDLSTLVSVNLLAVSRQCPLGCYASLDTVSTFTDVLAMRSMHYYM